MSPLETLAFRLGLSFARGIRAYQLHAETLCAYGACPRQPWSKYARFCSTHHSRFYRGAAMENACEKCGKPIGKHRRLCAKCRKPTTARNVDWFARKRADPAWWEERKQKLREQAAARRARVIGGVAAALLWPSLPSQQNPNPRSTEKDGET